jgi:hypothetical protein
MSDRLTEGFVSGAGQLSLAVSGEVVGAVRQLRPPGGLRRLEYILEFILIIR